jgi:XTP/dITP diphosphohydrolase
MPVTLSLLFATSNKNKFAEAQAILGRAGIRVEQYSARPPELQSDSIEEIARDNLLHVLEEVRRPVFVEDAGMFIHQLNGFPGPYSSYVLRTIGNPGILRLMGDIKERGAVFRSAVAYGGPGQPCIVFVGETQGQITHQIRGTHWGFDPIFSPDEGDGRTYAELNSETKNRISHRAKALMKLADWLRANVVKTA